MLSVLVADCVPEAFLTLKYTVLAPLPELKVKDGVVE
jgi:hypothetical protein